MPAALVNVLVGLAQTAVPSLLTYGLSNHWFDGSVLATVGAIATAIGAAAHSAATTVVASKK